MGKHEFKKHFSHTLQLLAEQGPALCQEYLSEMDLQSLQSPEDLRYFAGFVRQKVSQGLCAMECQVVAQWEGIHCLLKYSSLDFKTKAEPGTVALNPSLQILVLEQDNAILQRKRGLYAFIAGPDQAGVIEKRLNEAESLLLDLLMENERKFRPEQLLEMADLEVRDHQEISLPRVVDFQKGFSSLQDVGILRVVD